MPKKGFKRESQKERKKRLSILGEPSLNIQLNYGVIKPENLHNNKDVFVKRGPLELAENVGDRKAMKENDITVDNKKEGIGIENGHGEAVNDIKDEHNVNKLEEVVKKKGNDNTGKIEIEHFKSGISRESGDMLHVDANGIKKKHNVNTLVESVEERMRDQEMVIQLKQENNTDIAKKETVNVGHSRQNGNIDEVNVSTVNYEIQTEGDLKEELMIMKNVNILNAEKAKEENMDIDLNQDSFNVDTQNENNTDAEPVIIKNMTNNKKRRLSLKSIKRETQKERKKRLSQMAQHSSFDVYPNHGIINIEAILSQDKEKQKEFTEHLQNKPEQHIKDYITELSVKKPERGSLIAHATNITEEVAITMKINEQPDDLTNNILRGEKACNQDDTIIIIKTKNEEKTEVNENFTSNIEKQDRIGEEENGSEKMTEVIEDSSTEVAKNESDSALRTDCNVREGNIFETYENYSRSEKTNEDLDKEIKTEEESENILQKVMTNNGNSMNIYHIVHLDSLDSLDNIDEESGIEEILENAIDSFSDKTYEVTENLAPNENNLNKLDEEAQLEEAVESLEKTILEKKYELTENAKESICNKEEENSLYRFSEQVVEKVFKNVEENISYQKDKLTKNLVSKEDSFYSINETNTVKEALEIIGENITDNKDELSKNLVAKKDSFNQLDEEEIISERMMESVVDTSIDVDKYEFSSSSDENLDYETSGLETEYNATIEQTIDNRKIGQIINNSTIGQTVDNVNIGQTIDRSHIKQVVDNAIIGQPIENATIGQFIDNATIGQTIDNSPFEQTVDSATIGKAVDNAAIGQSADKGIIGRSVNNSTIGQTVDNSTVKLTVDNGTIEQSIVNATIEQTINNSNIEQTVDNATIRQSVDNATIGQPVDNAIIGQSVDNTTIGQTVDNATIVQPVDNPTIGQSVDNVTIGQTVNNFNIGQTVDYGTIEQSVANATIGQIIDIATMEQSIDNATIEQTINNFNIEQTVDNANIEQTVDNANIGQAVDNATIGQIIDIATIEQSIDNDTIEQTINNFNIEQTVDNANNGQAVDNATNGQPVYNATIEQAVDNVTVGQAIDNANIGQPVDNPTIEQSVDNVTTGQTVNNANIGHIVDYGTIEQSVANTTIGQIVDNATIEQTINNDSIGQTEEKLDKTNDKLNNIFHSTVDQIDELSIDSVNDMFLKSQGKFNHIDHELGFGYVSETDDKPRAKVILKGTSPFFDNTTKMSHHRMAHFHFYSLAFSVRSQLKDGSGRTVYLLKHFLDIPSLSSQQLQSIRVVACKESSLQEFDFIKPLWIDKNYICVEQRNYAWFQVISEFDHLPIQMNLVPFCQQRILHPTIFICPLPRGRHHIQKMLQENPEWRKCGYEEPCVLNKGIVYQFFNQDGIDVPSYGHVKTETRSEDTLWVKYTLQRGKSQTFIRIILKDQNNQSEIVYNGQIGLYEYMRLDSDLCQYQKSPVKLDLTKIDDSLLADASIPGKMSNMEPFFQFARAGRLTPSQLLAITEKLGVTRNADLSQREDIQKEIKEMIHDWKDQEGPGATLLRFISILRMTDVALTSIALEIYQNVINRQWV